MLHFPEARNQILIRLENMSDLFDGTVNGATPTFNIRKYAKMLFEDNNAGVSPAGMKITERTLSNN